MNVAKRLVWEHELDIYEMELDKTYEELSCYYSDYYIYFDNTDYLELERFTYEN